MKLGSLPVVAARFAAAILFAEGIATSADFSGASAFKYTQASVGFGARPSGSAANRQLQAYIRTQLRTFKCEVIGRSIYWQNS